MIQKLSLRTVKFGIPILLILCLIVLPKTSAYHANAERLSLGIILDLLITMPLIYFLLIRKTKLPNFTTLYVFILGLIIASFIIPTEHQDLLSKIKFFAIPILEIVILSTVIYKISQINKSYKRNSNVNNDFYDKVHHACQDIFPGRIGRVLATEIAVIYYFFSFKKNKEVVLPHFSYYKKSGIKTVIGVFIFLLIIETFVVHLLLMRWNEAVAWVLTFLSVYTLLQIVSILKSMNRRLISFDFENKQLELRYGIACQATIPFQDIDYVEAKTRRDENDVNNVSLSVFDLLDSHNVCIHLIEKHTLYKLYGMKKRFKSISLYADQKDLFIKTIEGIIEHNN